MCGSALLLMVIFLGTVDARSIQRLPLASGRKSLGRIMPTKSINLLEKKQQTVAVSRFATIRQNAVCFRSNRVGRVAFVGTDDEAIERPCCMQCCMQRRLDKHYCHCLFPCNLLC